MLCKCDQYGPKETLRSSFSFVGLRGQTFGRVQNTCSHNYPQYLSAGPLWLFSCESHLQHTYLSKHTFSMVLNSCPNLYLCLPRNHVDHQFLMRFIKDFTSLYIDFKTLFKKKKSFYITELQHLVPFLFLLPTGDRIVKVNGESIIGKTYSQVIALIQNR